MKANRLLPHIFIPSGRKGQKRWFTTIKIRLQQSEQVYFTKKEGRNQAYDKNSDV